MLHSDDVEVDSKELPAGAVTRIRSVGGLEELDATQTRSFSELPASETITEMRSDATTLKSSNSRL